MTVIIAKRHSGGFVMGADSEETAQTMKRAVPKLPAYINIHQGSLIVGGAGPGCYIDDLTQQLLDYFSMSVPTIGQLEEYLRTKIRDYYNSAVIAWPTREERQDNDFSLLVGAIKYEQREKGLWISEKGSLVRVSAYAAIGIGAEYARALLDDRPWGGPLSMDALLTIYVLQKVKQHIPYCGKASHVVCVGAQTRYIFDELVKEAEALFEKYDDSAKRTFITTIHEKNPRWEGFDDDSDKQTLENVKKLRSEFRALIERLHCEPFEA